MPNFRYSRFKPIYTRAPILQRLKPNNGFQSAITPDTNPFGVEYIFHNRGQAIYNNVGSLLHSSQAFLNPNSNGIGIVEHGRGFSTQAGSEEPRDSLEYDVVIVGAGPAGLSAAIKFKQLCREKNRDLSVCVVEKGAEVGAHILSGNVFEPRSLNELIPDWKEQGAPLRVPVSCDKFWLLTENRSFPLPSPFSNEGNYVISLSELVRWLSQKAKELGVEIYPGFAASEDIGLGFT